MRAAWHRVWGCAGGPVRSLEPRTRLLVGLSLLVAALVAPSRTWFQAAVPGGLMLVWLALCRPPLKMLGYFFVFALVLLLPYFLLAPFLHPGPVLEAFASPAAMGPPARVLLYGTSAMLISLSTLSTLTQAELREALVSLPLPRLVSGILVQIVHQTGGLIYETRSMTSAMAVRGATRSSGRSALRVLFAMPRVWLPRILARAERVSLAMELRGYTEEGLGEGRGRVRLKEIWAVAMGIAVLASAVALRLGSLA